MNQIKENSGIIIRKETEKDFRETENLVREAFWNVYKPGCSEHYVLHCLRSDRDFVPELDFVMEKDGKLIGQIAFVRGEIAADEGRTVPVLTFGPVCIHPDYKHRGYGRMLIEYALKKAEELGFNAVFIEGDIGFYGKCGFDTASKFGIDYHGEERGADVPYFLCRELKKDSLSGITGVYRTPSGYFVDEDECEEFDKGFPPKEKLRLPGQLF